MSSTTYPYATPLGDQPADSAGRRWVVRRFGDDRLQAVDLRVELLAQALVDTGGVVIRPTLDLTGAIATITGPVLGITPDGLTPVLADPTGEDVALDLDTLGSGFADGTHGIVLRAFPVTSTIQFTTPEVAVRDPQGNIIQTTPAETVTYQVTQYLGTLALIEGATPDDAEVLIATVDLATGTWSNLIDAGDAPRLRARVEDLSDVDTTARADGFLLAWDAVEGKHVYVDPLTIGGGS